MKSIFTTITVLVGLCFFLCLPIIAAEQKTRGEIQSKTLVESFEQVLKEGDVGKVKVALAQGADVEKEILWPLGGDVGGEELRTPLLGVYYFFSVNDDKRLNLIKLLLEHNAKIDPHLIWSTSIAGNVPLLELFLVHKADPNAKSNWGTTPISGAEQSYAYVLKRIQEVGPEEASKPQQIGWPGPQRTRPPLTIQKQNLEKVIEMLKKAGAKNASA